MSWKKHAYDEIPGTYVFDGRRAHPSYALNKLLYSLNDEQNRTDFDQDPAAFCDRFGLENPYREAVLAQDFLSMLRLGANIYYLAKMAVPRGVSVQDAGAAFQGISGDEFRQNLLDRAIGLEEKLKKVGGYWHG